MCKILEISRSLIYYKNNKDLENNIKQIFKESRINYGSRKIKVEFKKNRYNISIRRIIQIMTESNLVLNYTIKQYRIHKNQVNNEKIDNIVNREFNRKNELDVVVSDLTYVNVQRKWNYICLIIVLYNREIIGYASRKNKTAELVIKAISKIKSIKIFHTNRGNEFKIELLTNYKKRLK